MFNHSREVLLLRFWEAGNVKRGERTYGCGHTTDRREGRLYLNSTSETHIYFDSETAVGKEMLDKTYSNDVRKLSHSQSLSLKNM
ncbi:hypothetical protein YC2023_081462 [Brassica napus]